MLAGITLHNFKAFDDVAVDLAPITLFLGPNNSGKSSILASLRLLAQTLASYDSQTTLLLSGTLGDFGTYKDIVFGNHRGRPIRLAITTVPKPRSEGWPASRKNAATMQLEFKYRARRRELILRSTELRQGKRSLLATRYSPDSERQLVERVGDHIVPSAMKSTLANSLRMENFVPYLRPVFTSSQEREGPFQQLGISETQLRQTLHLGREVSTSLREIDYIGAMRVPPSRTYLFSGERTDRIGATGENSAGILVTDTARPGRRSLRVLEAVTKWLGQARIAADVRIVPLSDRHYEIKVQHPTTKEYQNLADVGYGGSQVLPVLVGGYARRPNTTYIVEEPEIHLHPRAQAELGDFFLQLYGKGVQSLIETHSEHLVVRLQQHVASGKIPAKHVHIYYVYPKNQKKKVKLLRLDEKGQFLDRWPEGFFPERLEEAKQLARIRFSSEAKG